MGDEKIKKIPYLVIPIFIPFGGCDHQCVFCDQPKITGSSVLPSTKEIEHTIEKYLSTWKRGGRREVAFYGGTFTGFPLDIQEDFLKAACKYVEDGRIDALRISTRPDCIDKEIIELLKKYHVGAVELGVQSMVNKVLKLSERGHSGKETVRSVKLLKDAGFKVGIQIMPGLPGDDRDSVITTGRRVRLLKPDFVRIYPTLVIKDTPLHEMMKKGLYKPWELEDMLEVCGELYKIFTRASITMIRIGIQPTKELEKALVAGPYHPSFRQLVEERINAA